MKDIFEKMISRTNTMSRKWDSLEKHFGHTDVLPLWIADMDFQSPEPVREALAKLACDGVYGYTDPNEKIFNSIVSWFSRRHQWDISPASIHFTPGVLSGITFALEAFSKSGDGVVIQSPVYPPFAGIPNGMERKPLLNPLVEKEPGHYVMDLNGLEDIFQTATRLLHQHYKSVQSLLSYVSDKYCRATSFAELHQSGNPKVIRYE